MQEDPWDELGMNCAGYNSKVDRDFIAVMEKIRDKKYNTDIAQELGLSESHVELIQYILCSANICEYGTSPRGCWFRDYGENMVNPDEYINQWKKYYLQHWGEPYAPEKSVG